MMKRFAIVLVLIWAALPMFSQQEKEVKSFLQEVCTELEKVQNNGVSDMIITEKYCSTRYKALYNESWRMERQVLKECVFHCMGGIWTRISDYFDSVKYSVSEVQRTDNPKKETYRARLLLQFHCDSYMTSDWSIPLDLLVEAKNGTWRISDFLFDKDGSDTEMMEESVVSCANNSFTSYFSPKETILNAETKKLITQDITQIFKTIEKAYNQGNMNPYVFIRKYCSPTFTNFYKEVIYWETKLGMPTLDYNIWTRSSDCKQISYQVSDISFTAEGKALANILLSRTAQNGSKSSQSIQIELIPNEGKWLIDNFIDLPAKTGAQGFSDRAFFTESLKKHIEHWLSSLQ